MDFDPCATVNAAPAYLVNDVYRKYVAPDASERTCLRLSYAAALLAVGVGVAVGFYVNSLNDILQWIVGALYGEEGGEVVHLAARGYSFV